jgi:hypothetical protein
MSVRRFLNCWECKYQLEVKANPGEAIILPVCPNCTRTMALSSEQGLSEREQALSTGPPAVDMVNHPLHYTEGRAIETITVLEDWAPTWPAEIAGHLWNVVKYAARCGRKGDPIEDLGKVIWYAQRAKDRLQSDRDAEEYPEA